MTISSILQFWRGWLSVLIALFLPAVVQAQFTFVTNNGAITLTGYTGPGGNVVIPSNTNGYPVTSIGTSAFYFKPVLNVIIPNSVTNLQTAAFENCSGMTNVTIGSSVASIGDYVFMGCSALTNVTIPNGVASLGKSVFFQCSGLRSVTIGTHVSSIGDYAFWSTSLTNVAIPDSVINIGSHAFESCYSLKGVTIGNQVATIGDVAFAGCVLTNVTIPDSVTNIGVSAFANCTSLHRMYFRGNAPSVAGGTGSADNTVFNGESGLVYYVPGTTGWGTNYGGFSTALWYQPQPQILGSGYGLGVQSNRFNFTISWATNTSVVVQASTNLLNWSSIVTNPLASGTNAFSDSNYTNFPRRFYRVRSL